MEPLTHPHRMLTIIIVAFCIEQFEVFVQKCANRAVYSVVNPQEIGYG